MNTVTSKDGTTIAFDRSGQGPPIILVGGALSDRTAGGPLAQALAPRFTVVAYDRRGRGDSGDTQPYAVEREIDDIGALIAESGGSAHLFGHSSGAVLALSAAAGGLPVTKLALYEPPFIVDDTRPPIPDGYVQTLSQLAAADRRGDAVEFFLTKVVGMPPEAVAPMREAPFWSSMEAVAHTLAYDGAIVGDNTAGTSLTGIDWPSITVPTLVMDGGASPPWQRHAVRAVAGTLPRAQHRTLEGQDHGPDPEMLGRCIEEFLAGRAAGAEPAPRVTRP